MATSSADRILSLDLIRGIAVMGIFSVNVVGMAMIEEAYFFPPAFGFDGLGDRVMWAVNFVIVDGRFRSLFSILFGASMVLVIERAEAAGKAGWKVHYARMAVLLLFGLAHYYLLWWGDILSNYALVGMAAFVFWRLPPRLLLLASALSLAMIYVPTVYEGTRDMAAFAAKAAPDATADQRAAFERKRAGLYPTPEELAEAKAAHASIRAHLRSVLANQPYRPFNSVPGYGLETLGLMLLGMAGYKSGFLTGSWSRRRYAWIAGVLVGGSLAIFGYAAFRILTAEFAPLTYFPWDQVFVVPLHPFSAIGYAALIMLVFRPGAVAERFAAVGRAAFSNYLGATLIGTMLFYGFGFALYGELSRGQAWLIVPLVWGFMLLWSKWWLDRFRYGPFEWAWRSLARGRWQPMRKPPATQPAVA